MKKFLNEWFIPAPWGKIAMVSWGDPAGKPVLMIHGRQDSVATFLPLSDYLPEGFHYVGIDMPGNGKSDAFPIGVKLTRFHFIAAVEAAIKHLKWDQFVYVGHSMGCEHGLYYNAIYPHRITKLILLDFGPSLQRLQVHDFQEYYTSFYQDYYTNYKRDNFATRVYSWKDAVAAVVKARGLTDKQAELILSRSCVKVGDNRYRLSWDLRLRYLAPQNYLVEDYYKLFSMNAPPTILLSATNETSQPYAKGKEAATQILQLLRNNVENFKICTVEGGHDVHFTNPERLASYVVEFLNKDFGTKSKL